MVGSWGFIPFERAAQFTQICNIGTYCRSEESGIDACEHCFIANISVVIPCFSNPLNYSLLHCTKYCQKTRNPPSLHRTFDPLRSIYALFESIVACIPLLDCDRFGQVPGEIDIEAFANSEPVGNELQRNDVQ